MYEIFQKLLDEKGIKAYDISKATGISSSTLTDWKMGRTTPKQDKLKLIADYFGVSLDYLLTGKEPNMGKFSAQADLLIKIKSDKKLMGAIEKYFELSDRQKNHVIDLIDVLSEE